MPEPNRESIVKDMNRVAELNPTDAQLPLDYAQMLQQLNLNRECVQQLRLALHYNDLLDPTEPKRFDTKTIAGIQATIAAMESQNSTTQPK